MTFAALLGTLDRLLDQLDHGLRLQDIGRVTAVSRSTLAGRWRARRLHLQRRVRSCSDAFRRSICIPCATIKKKAWCHDMEMRESLPGGASTSRVGVSSGIVGSTRLCQSTALVRVSLITSLAAALAACGGGGGGSTPTSTQPSLTVSGAIQKGPFIVGSTVTINALANDGSNTASTVTTQTTNNFGDFTFAQPTGTKVQISATGFYRNEITGAVSSNSITLRSVYSVTSASTQNAYVNVLTHLTSGRVLELMKQGVAAQEAMDRAETDFLQQFSSVVPGSGQKHFNSISIYSNRGASGSAYLLAVSAIVYQHAIDRALANATNTDAELSVFLNELSADFASDGVVNMPLSNVRAAIPRIDPDAVMANVASWIGSHPDYATVDIDQYLDTDLDGVFNSVDTDDDDDGMADADDPARYSPGFVVSDSSATTDEDTPVTLDLSANSVNEHPTVVEILTPPSHGSLSGQYPTVATSLL